MSHPFFALSLASACLAVTPAFAGTLTVGPLGSGATYTEIGPAVAAAQSGDTILVQAGTYQETATVVVDKALTIIGAGSATTNLHSRALNPLVSPLPLQVTGLAAGEEVRIAGLGISSSVLGGGGQLTLLVEDCDGRVLFADVQNSSTNIVAGTTAVATVRGSDQVVFDNCRFVGTPFGNGTLPPVTGLLIDDSRAFINNSTIVGGSATALFSTGVPADGAHGLVVTNSWVRISRTSITGGDGTPPSPFFTPTIVTQGGAAAFVENGQLLARGGSGNLLQGGQGGFAVVGGVSQNGPGGPAAELSFGALMSTVGDSVLFAGNDFNGVLTTPTVTGPGQWVPFQGRFASLASSTAIAAPGSTVMFDLAGPANGQTLAYYSLNQIQALDVPGAFGEVLMPIGSIQLFATKALSPLGEATAAVNVPANPGLIGVSVLAQSVAAGPGGEVSISSPTFVAIH